MRLYKDELHESFINEYTDYAKLSKKKFSQWLSIFGHYHGYKIDENKTNNRRWIEFGRTDKTPSDPDDIWDELNDKAKEI